MAFFRPGRDGDLTLLRTLTAACLLLAPVAPATAHTGIATTVPDHDAVIERAPTLLRFQFPGEVTITNLRILPVDSNLIQNGEAVIVRLPRNRVGQSTAFGQDIDVDIPLLEPGRYQVVFQVVSIDGHMLADDFNFTILDSAR